MCIFPIDEKLHSSMVVDADPVALGEKIVADMKKKREALI